MLVDWSDFAKADLENLINYISRDSEFYARLFGERIVLATRQLEDFPKSGRPIPEADDDLFREIIVQGYRVMYTVELDRVLILSVMHGSRNLENPENRPW